MNTSLKANILNLFEIKWRPSRDLAVVGLSWILVVGALYVATEVVGQEVAGGLIYFFLYAVLGALVFGVGLPLYWMVIVCKRSIAELGISKRMLGVSLVLQMIFAGMQYYGTLAKAQLPVFELLLPLLALSLTIGFFEAIFWRGWVLLRLEEAFGLLPAILLGSVLYSAYHIGYGMTMSEMVFLFFIGIMYAAVFRLTKNIFILWPVFQPMGQLVTLVRDRLTLPPIAALGFFEVLLVMLLLVWLANRNYNRRKVER
jgi:hypothetical protein